VESGKFERIKDKGERISGGRCRGSSDGGKI
jgi:hypothetical protein